MQTVAFDPEDYDRSMEVVTENADGEQLMFEHTSVEAAFAYGPMYVVRERHGANIHLFEYPLAALIRASSVYALKTEKMN